MDMLPATIAEVPAAAPPPIQVVARRSIFRTDERRYLTMPAGRTVLDILLEAEMAEWRDGAVHLPGNVRAEIDGNVIEREHWHRVRPKGGRLVNAYLIPANQRQAIIIGASIIIAVAAVYTGGLAAGAYGPLAGGAYGGSAAALAVGAVASAAVSLGGSYALTEPWPAA